MYQLSVTSYSENTDIQNLIAVMQNFDYITIEEKENKKSKLKSPKDEEKELFLFNSKKFLSKHLDK